MKNILIFLLLSTLTANSQVKKAFTLGASASGGNLKAYSILSSANFGKDSGRLSWSVSPSFMYSVAPGYVMNARESMISGSLSHNAGKTKLIGFMEAENSYIKKIRIRGSVGAGVGKQFAAKRFKASISEALMPDFYFSEKRIDKDIFTLRSSSRIHIEAGQQLKLTSITFIQPSIWNNRGISGQDNFTLRTSNSIESPLSKALLVGCQLNYSISTFPHYINTSVSSYDWNFLITFKWKKC